MDLTEDSPCIIGSACRLPGGVLRTDSLWSVFNRGEWEVCSTLPPTSRGFSAFFQHHANSSLTGRGGWLGEQGIEYFDAQFFGIPDSEATTLRPNIRLALELTYEALENAGIPPSSLRGRNVSVSVGVGIKDGWDMKRWIEDGPNAFDHNWAASSDPSGVTGHISHAFDFRGTCSAVSNACASGAFALRDGIQSLMQENAEVAIVGSLTTHFGPAPFGWASSAGVASLKGRSSAFSPDADGYSPSEGAVFFVLKRRSAAQLSGDPIRGVIRALATGHNGSTRTLITPSKASQVALTNKVLAAAKLKPRDVTLVEAHGTGTSIGDGLEMEGIRSIFSGRDDNPLFVSSSKTILGHCHATAALVGILKVLSCFEHRIIPSHHVRPRQEFLKGSIIIPVEPTPLESERLIGQVNSFGFTGSVACIIIEQPLTSSTDFQHPSPSSLVCLVPQRSYLLPFSAKSLTALSHQIRHVRSWARETQCSLRDLAAVLGLSRDHHNHRCAVIASTLDDLNDLCGHFTPSNICLCDEGYVYAQPDNRITLELLNIENVDKETLDKSQQNSLENLIKEERILEAARLLYDRGHTLSFSSIYDKHDIDASVLTSFPFYHFDRKRHWKDSPGANIIPTSPPLPNTNISAAIPLSTGETMLKSQTTKNGSFITQEIFENLIDTFGAPIDIQLTEKSVTNGLGSHLLLTGGNGMLGANLLSRLLGTPGVTVYCIVRGEPWACLCSSFTRHHLPLQALHDARSDGSLKLLPTSNICGTKLGLSDSDYSMIVESVDRIVHAAWHVNFNLPLIEFHPLLRLTRNLGELCLAAKKRVKYCFIGSYASTFNYPGDLVPETPLEPRVSYSLAQGYAISKSIAEHSLLRIHNACSAVFQLSIIRIGQICGDTATGSWSRDEMMPMLIASLPALRALPLHFPEVSWIPSDVCADALREIVMLSPPCEDTSVPQIFHLSNPLIAPWLEIAGQMGEIAGVGRPKLLLLKDYVDLIKHQAACLPVSRLLPYFISSLEDGTLPQRYASLEVSCSLRFSSSLASCPPIGSRLLDLIVHAALQDQKQMPEVSRSLTHTPPSSFIFLFGPWSSFSNGTPNVPISNTTEDRILALAHRVRYRLGDVLDITDQMLEQQLKTLASQLTAVETLSHRGVFPKVVLGYCFGEYAAAISAGILSEETVVDILVRRAMVLRNINGAMLNVFCDISVVRRALASISSPPSIAIRAGPNHIVLSGSESQIECAETALCRQGVKTLLVQTTIPFHSALMDEPAINFLPFSYSPNSSTICYISGVMGGVLCGDKLSLKYWLRHMRDPVNFHQSMQYLRENFSGMPIVDIGPGEVLTKIISRYGWQDTTVTTTEKVSTMVGVTSQIQKPPVSDVTPHSTDPLPIDTPSDTSDPIRVALKLLEELFGYSPSDLLSRSLHSAGMQSMDFIRFADHFEAHTRLHITLSAFVSDTPLENIIREAMEAP